MPDDAISRRRRTEDGGQTPDAELLRLYAEENSEAAFAELVRRHLDLVYSAALRQVGGDAHGAHDVAQTVFTVLARKAAAVAGHPVLVGWLYTSTQHAAAKVRRSEARRRVREHEAQLMHELTAGDVPAVEWERLSPVLDEAMRELNDREREAVLLRFFAQRPFAEIGATLRVSEDAARMRVERALEKLRTVLARRGVTSTAVGLSGLLANQAVVAAPAGLAGSVVAGAAGAGTATGIFAFMSTIKLGVGGVVALLVLVGVATYQSRERDAAERELALVRTQHQARVTARGVQETRSRAGQQESVRLQKELDEAKARQVAVSKALPAPGGNALEEGRAFLERHPEVHRAFGDYVSASLRFQYAPMYRSLGWSEVQIRRFETVMGQGTAMAAIVEGGKSVSLPYGDRPDPSGYGRRFTEAMGGREGLVSYSEYIPIVAARRRVAEVASALYFTDTPLMPEQAEQLVRLFVDSRNSGEAAKTSVHDWNAVLAKSQVLLSPPQLAVIKSRQAIELFGLAMNRARAASASGSAAPVNAGK